MKKLILTRGSHDTHKNYLKVVEYVESFGCKFLSKEYKGRKHTHEFLCRCGDPFSQTIEYFIKKEYKGCKKCTLLQKKEKLYHSISYVENKVLEFGFELLSNYQSTYQPLKLKCLNCKDVVEQSFQSIIAKKDKFCASCCQKEKAKQKRIGKIDDIRNEVDLSGNLLLNVDVSDANSLLDLKCACGRKYQMKLYYFRHRRTNKCCPYCTENSSISNFEKEVKEFVSSITNGNMLSNDRTLLNGLEVDIYFPEHHLAIECDGVFWHSEMNGKKDNQYHINKTKLLEDLNIQLIHIFDNEWNHKQPIVKSILRSKLGVLSGSIYARKCEIVEVPVKEKGKFLTDNHIQGNDKSHVKLGLKYENELVAVMTFVKSRFNKGFDWEISRYCNKLDHHVIGGMSRLLKHFRKLHSGSIITYADRRYSYKNNVYSSSGFELLHISKPNYFYFKVMGGSDIITHRQTFQKHKLKMKLDQYDSNLTEWENMKMNGYDRIWDCGNFVYTLT